MRSRTWMMIGPLALANLLLSGCFGTPAPLKPVVVEDASSSEAGPTVMRGAYEGTVVQAGVSTYMEGTHRLDNADGSVLLLQSDLVDLDLYLDQPVRLTGLVRETVEQGGLIVDVEEIVALESPAASSEPAFEAASSAIASSVPPAPATSSARPVVRPASSAPSPVVSSASAIPASSASPVAPAPVSSAAAPQADAVTAAMARAAVNGGTFTQIFCTRHVGFCVPLHKSWYYNSFGATSSSLWHIEVSSKDVEQLGDGPLIINLVSGVLDAGRDGSVRDSGGYVVGYRAWTDNRHFEVSAPVQMREAVLYIVQNFTVYQPEAPSSALSTTSAAAESSSAAASTSSR